MPGLRALLLGLTSLAVLMLWGLPAQAEKRVALVVGNAAYQHYGPLTNPPQDAAAVAETLRRAD